MLTHLHSRWFICFPKLRFSDQRKTPQWQTGLCPNNAVRNLIRESKTYQIASIMQTNKRAGMQTMDDALYDLYMRKLIDADNAVTYAQDPVSMNKKVNFDF